MEPEKDVFKEYENILKEFFIPKNKKPVEKPLGMKAWLTKESEPFFGLDRNSTSELQRRPTSFKWSKLSPLVMWKAIISWYHT